MELDENLALLQQRIKKSPTPEGAGQCLRKADRSYRYHQWLAVR